MSRHHAITDGEAAEPVRVSGGALQPTEWSCPSLSSLRISTG